MKPVVFDTNVWISAYAFNGRLRILLDYVIEDRLRVAVSQAILDELVRVLCGVKFGFPIEVVEALVREIRDVAMVVQPTNPVKAVKNDPDDDRILECAVSAGAEVIVTGDGHLLALGVFRGIRILSPTAFLDELSQGSAPGGKGVREPQTEGRVNCARPGRQAQVGDHSRVVCVSVKRTAYRVTKRDKKTKTAKVKKN
jgi:putative PIN family toxin of toxin-antitoxin system